MEIGKVHNISNITIMFFSLNLIYQAYLWETIKAEGARHPSQLANLKVGVLIQRVRGTCRGFLKMLKPLENLGIPLN